MGLELTTLQSRVTCFTNCAGQEPWIRGDFKAKTKGALLMKLCAIYTEK